jgi:hypothetical protein
VREIAHYRIEHDVADDTPGLGPQPASGETRRQWRNADRVLQQTQRHLGRELAHTANRTLSARRPLMHEPPLDDPTERKHADR